MTRASSALAVALAIAGLTGCSARRDAFTRSLALADRSYAQGRYDEAAKRYDVAARKATTRRDRDEAVYRQAESFGRGGQNLDARAALERLLAASPHGERAPRAAYEHAVLTLQAGDVQGGSVELDALLRRYPDSGLSPAVLARRIVAMREGGETAVRAYLDGLIPKLQGTELGQYLHYEYARSLESDGHPADARARYLFVARRYPYPAGALWDDSLYRAADLDARLGDPRAAISHLEGMLAERETAHFIGSYEKGRFEDAAFRIGELQRDALHAPTAARRSFERFWSDFPRSRLRDEAAWQGATLAAEAGDQRGACRTLEALTREMPDSRYVGCAPRLCPTLHPKVTTCHEYLLRKPGTAPEAR